MTTRDAVSTVVNCISLKASPTSHNGHISRAISSLISVGTDVSVVSSSGESIPANRSLLSLVSPFLSQLLSSIPCCTSSSIILPDCSTHALRHLISIISNGFTTSQFGDGIFKDINEVMDTAKLLNIAIVDLSYERGPALSENEGINEDEQIEHVISQDIGEKVNVKEEILDEITIDQQIPVMERLETDDDFINEETLLGSSGKNDTFPCLSKIPNNPESPSNICHICNAKFSQKKILFKHMATHDSKDLFSCEKCGKTFKSKTTYNFHKLSHGSLPKVKSTGKSSITGDPKEFSCPACPRTYTRKDNLNQHMNIHTGLSPYKCLNCEKAFKTRLMKNNHMSICVVGKHVGNKSKNKDTEKNFEYDHILEHKNNYKKIAENLKEIIGKPLQTNLSCNVCQKRFTTENSLELHVIKGCEKSYKCPFCPTKFDHAGNIKRHVKNKHPATNQSQYAIETKEKANDLLLVHKCKYCSKAFLKEKSLKTHTKNKHLEENIGTTKNNNAKEKEKKLQLNHKCKYCSKSFFKEKSLKIHVKSCKVNVCKKNVENKDQTESIEREGDSTSELPIKEENFDIKCDDCGELFQLHEALMKHLAQRICFTFRCSVCPEKFKKKEDLDFHVENNHFVSDMELYSIIYK